MPLSQTELKPPLQLRQLFLTVSSIAIICIHQTSDRNMKSSLHKHYLNNSKPDSNDAHMYNYKTDCLLLK